MLATLRHELIAIVLLALLLCGLVAALGNRDLNSSHEARAGQNARMILETGEWDLPRLLNGRAEMQKPPLYYWLVALVGWLQGEVDAWAIRLPAALSAMGCVAFLIFFGWKQGRPKEGLWAGVILATSVHFCWLAQVGRIDMVLTLTTTLALGGFWLGATGWRIVAFLALAAGMLLKGPIAWILPGGVLLAHRIVLRQSLVPLSTWLWGMPLLVAITLPWFLHANRATQGKFFDVFFWYHNVERGLGSEVLQTHPWWFYFPRAMLDLAPWSLLAPVVWWMRRTPPLPRFGGEGRGEGDRSLSQKTHDLASDAEPLTPVPSPPEYRGRGAITGDHDEGSATFGLIWFVTMFAFLSLMRFKRADYLLPAYPGLAWCLGCWLANCKVPIARWGMAAVLSATLAGWGAFHRIAAHDAVWTLESVAREIRQKSDRPVIFFRTESHALAFHVGRPLDTIVEWENLEWWANQQFPIFIVMPADCADSWEENLIQSRLDEVLRVGPELDGKGFVVMRARGSLIE